MTPDSAPLFLHRNLCGIAVNRNSVYIGISKRRDVVSGLTVFSKRHIKKYEIENHKISVLYTMYIFFNSESLERL